MFKKRANINRVRSLVGKTPLVKVSDKIYAKLETRNLSGSIKDRTIAYIVKRDMLYGNIGEDTILCEATSGNAGISLSMIAASIGNPCVIFMPKDAAGEQKKMIRVYGAKIIETPAGDLSGAIAMRDAFLKTNNNSWSPRQFSNELAIDCHERVTAPEIHKQVIDLNKRWVSFIHGAGSGSTIEGVRRYLKKSNMLTKVCMVSPAAPDHGIVGLNSSQKFLAKEENMDRIIQISTEEAVQRAKLFIEETGILVGISSGANLLASERWIRDNPINGVVITVLCDRGERYFSIYDK